MQLLDTLQDEHALIDQALGSLRTYVAGLIDGTADPDDGRRFAAFFTSYAGDFHHDREERVLFRALVTEAELPVERGPVYALGREHAEMEEWLREMTRLLEEWPHSGDDRARLRNLATRYSRALWRHIDAENSVLFPEAEKRLRRCGIRELADRPMSESEAAAREGAASLLAPLPAGRGRCADARRRLLPVPSLRRDLRRTRGRVVDRTRMGRVPQYGRERLNVGGLVFFRVFARRALAICVSQSACGRSYQRSGSPKKRHRRSSGTPRRASRRSFTRRLRWSARQSFNCSNRSAVGVRRRRHASPPPHAGLIRLRHPGPLSSSVATAGRRCPRLPPGPLLG